MRRAATAIVILALCGSAGAKEMNGVFGLGAQRTLGGVQGFDVVYGVGKLVLNGTIDIFFNGPSNSSPSNPSGLDLRLAAGVLYPLVSGESAALSVGGRFDISAVKGGGTEFAIEAPARVEWYITPHLSIYGEVGIILAFVPTEGSSLMPAGTIGQVSSQPKGTLFTLFGTYLTGGGGFTVFFD